MLAVVVLARVRLVMQFDIGADDLLVVPLDADQLLGHVLPEMVRDLDVASPDDYVRSADGSAHVASTRSRRRPCAAATVGDRAQRC